jgi:hypothetical protein
MTANVSPGGLGRAHKKLGVLLGVVLLAMGLSTTTAGAATGGKATFSVADLTVTEGTAPDGQGSVVTANVAVTLTGSRGRAASVEFVTLGNGYAGMDYAHVDTRLSWIAGEGDGTKTVPVPIVGDGIDEYDETFSAFLDNASGASIGRSPATVTIVDDDGPPTLALQWANAIPIEGDSATFSIEYPFGATEKDVAFSYRTADGTAVAGVDYTSASGRATLTPSRPTWTLTVPTLRDSAVEDDESFNLVFSDPDNVVVGSTSNGWGVVRDWNLHPVIEAPYDNGYSLGACYWDGLTEWCPYAKWWTGAMLATTKGSGTAYDRPAPIARSIAEIGARGHLYTNPTRATYRFVYALDQVGASAQLGSSDVKLKASASSGCGTCTITTVVETLADSATGSMRAPGTYTLDVTITNGGSPIPKVDVYPIFDATAEVVADTAAGAIPDYHCTGLDCPMRPVYEGDGSASVSLRLLRVEVTTA